MCSPSSIDECDEYVQALVQFVAKNAPEGSDGHFCAIGTLIGVKLGEGMPPDEMKAILGSIVDGIVKLCDLHHGDFH